ncbi:hypothetical protein NM208_g912 [Fusarium decemcellulare]|uniref:Uncharacterized protein n=1 Tax=Fusarium decemcellulare TaxID=57161 RepID=A0ACC1SXP1_9HYPO|nr:hypothetical protein NM208_g912 [Fusarium decemcellulare]
MKLVISTLALSLAPLFGAAQPTEAVEKRQAGNCHVNRLLIDTWQESAQTRRRIAVSASGIEPDTYCPYWQGQQYIRNVQCYYNEVVGSFVIDVNTDLGAVGDQVFNDRYGPSLREWWTDYHCTTGCPYKYYIDNFELLKVVGKGSFGNVMRVRKKDTNRIYALKTIRKAKIISRSEVAHTLAERSVLGQINNPFIVPLTFSFRSPEKLYFVLAFVNGGELFYHLTNERRFDINRSRFYTAELLCALECLHGFNVIYRDLKPENILLDYQGHIALCDFGLCKLDIKDEDQTHTFCGTPEYLAPELLLAGGEGYNKTVDWWTLSVLLYEMLTGLPPFYDEVTNEIYRKILSEPLHFPGPEIVPPAAKDLLTKLLNRNPADRLGANSAAKIKAHPFFHAIDWKKLLQRKYEPAFKLNVVNALDTANFAPEFTSEPAQDSYVDDPVLSQTMQNQFAGFSYSRLVEGLDDAGGSIKDPSFVSAPWTMRWEPDG